MNTRREISNVDCDQRIQRQSVVHKLNNRPNMDEDKIDLAAQFIAQGRLGPSLIPRPPEDLISNVFDGYAVQAKVNRILRLAKLGPVVGHKIGCTTNVMQSSWR